MSIYHHTTLFPTRIFFFFALGALLATGGTAAETSTLQDHGTSADSYEFSARGVHTALSAIASVTLSGPDLGPDHRESALADHDVSLPRIDHGEATLADHDVAPLRAVDHAEIASADHAKMALHADHREIARAASQSLATFG